MPRRSTRAVGAALLAFAAALALAAGVVAGRSAGERAVPAATVLDGRSPRVDERGRVRVLVALRRPSLAQRAAERLDPREQRAHVRSLRGEARALQGALRARGVSIERPVELARVWNGFAATVSVDDLPELEALGARVESVRRFFPALASVRALPGRAPAGASSPGRALPALAPRGRAGPALALLDSGVDPGLAVLPGRVARGHDAVGGAGRGEHGTEIAGVLAGLLPAGERLLTVRVAGERHDPATGATEEYGTTDELMAGLERTVDPDGDGDTEDAVPVALVGLNSPYAGFARSPEARAAEAALELGTLVVAPAGNEGPRAGRFGTVGSPAAAASVLAVGVAEGGARAPALPEVRVGLATGDGRSLVRGSLLGGEGTPLRARATALLGPSQADPRARGRAAGTGSLEYFGLDARPRARGAVVVVPAPRGAARAALAPAAAAAAQAGAAALVVCAERPLAGLPRGLPGRMPVIGLSGADGRRALELTRSSAGVAFVGAPTPREGGPVAATSSQGPTYALAAKPDLAAPGAAITVRPGGRRAAVVGTSVAAAHVAATALELHRRRPAARAAQLAAALVGTAAPDGPRLAAGAGRPSAVRAAGAAVSFTPRGLALRGRSSGTAAGRLRLANGGPRPLSLVLDAMLDTTGARVSLAPARLRLAAGTSATVRVETSAAAPGGEPLVTGRVRVRGGGPELNVPLAIARRGGPPPALGPLRLVERRGRVRGVRFPAGRVTRAAAGVAVEPLGALRLELLDASGGVARELTPAGGALDVLPGEYSYTLTATILSQLERGSYRFRASASGTEGGGPALRRSAEFSIP